jgi:tetratricopeptide (TPR) repeat protein
MRKVFYSFGLGRFTAFTLLFLQLAACSSPEDRAKAHYERGMKLLSEHQTAKASVELRNAVRLKRDMVDAWKAMAQIDETNHDWPRLILDLRAIVESVPTDSSDRLKLGRLLLLAGIPDEVLSLANTGLEHDSGNADLHAMKAAAKLKLHDPAEAVKQAQTALQLDPANGNALMVLALVKLDDGDAKAALSLLESSSVTGAKALEDDAGLQLLKVKLFQQIGDLASAEATLNQLVEMNPQNLDYRRLLISFYMDQRRIDQAEKALRALVATAPADPNLELDLVKFLYTVKKAPSAARDELNARIKAGGDAFSFQIALANMDVADGHSAAARQQLQNLIDTTDIPERKQAARLALAQTYLGGTQLDLAAKQVNDALTADPHNASALKLRALIHMERLEFDAAITDLGDALNAEPRSAELMSLLAIAYERNGQIELADKQFADAVRASNFDPNISAGYVEFLERRGSLSRAEDVFAELTKRQPSNVPLLSKLGELRLARQNWDGARDVADMIRKAGNADAADQILAAALLGRSQYDQAITILKAAYNRNPTADQSINALVRALLAADKKDEASSFLKAVLAKDSRNAEALVLSGSIELGTGNTEQARARFAAAVEAQPKAVTGYQALANFYVRQKNYNEAARIAQTGIQAVPNALSLRLIAARAFEQTGDIHAAISQYETILAGQPTNLIAANNLAVLLLDRTTDQASLQKAQSIAAILRNSPVPQFKDTLGWASYRQADYRNALSLCEQAAAALPDQAAVRYHLGMSLLALGQPAKASEQLKKALELAPDQRLADDIRTALEKTGS